MDETGFRLVYKGDIAPGTDLDEVKKELGRLFNSDLERINTLFSGKSVVLKSNLTEKEALRLQNVFNKSGAIAVIESLPYRKKAAQAKKGNPGYNTYTREPVDIDKDSVLNRRTSPEKFKNGGKYSDRPARPSGQAVNRKPLLTSCPGCGAVRENSESCVNCGIDYKKYESDLAREISGHRPQAQRSSPCCDSVDDLFELAAAQKLLIWAAIVGFSVFMSPILYFLVVPFRLYAVSRISKALRFEKVQQILYLGCMFIPLLGMILLLLLNHKACKSVRSAGLAVGFTGVSKADLAALGTGGNCYSLPAPLFIASVLVAGLAGLATGMLPSTFAGGFANSGSGLENEISKANRQLPKVIDSETRIDKITSGPDKLITYNYTLTNHPAADLEPAKFLEGMAGSLKNETCRNSETSPFIRKGYSIAFSYKGNDGAPIATVTVEPDYCGSM